MLGSVPRTVFEWASRTKCWQSRSVLRSWQQSRMSATWACVLMVSCRCELILHPSPDPHSTTWDVSVPLITCSDVQSPLNSLPHSSYQDWITATWFSPVFRMLVYDRCSVSWILLLAWCWDNDRETVQRQRSKSSTGFLFGRVSNTNCASSLIEHWMERPHDTFGVVG